MSLSTKKLSERFGKTKREDGVVEVAGIDLFSRERVRSVVRHKLRLRHGTSTRVPTGGSGAQQGQEKAAEAAEQGNDKQAAILEKEAKHREKSEKAMADAAKIMDQSNLDAARSKVTTEGQGLIPGEKVGDRGGEISGPKGLANGKGPAVPTPGIGDGGQLWASEDKILAGNEDPKKSSVSVHSTHSGKSKATDATEDKKKENKSKLMGALTSAIPNAIDIAAPAKALKDDDEDGSDTDDDLEEHAFDHPSTYVDQRWIWIPKWEEHPDLSEELARELKDGGVDASDLGAFIEGNGMVLVNRGPPDEDWSGGHDK